MFDGVFSGRRVFVTGHTGFKGSWLTQWLLALGAHVTGYALDPPTDPSLFEALALGNRRGGMTSARGLKDGRGDVRDFGSLRAALAEAESEVVFHLAAQPIVRRSYSEPRLTFETNAMGTVNVLEAARGIAAEGLGLRVVVIATTDKCYENRETSHAYVETDALGGFDPYSASKACSELVAAAYRRSFFSGAGAPLIATVRAGNVLGGGDWGDDRIVPDCVRALTAGEQVVVRNPSAVRPWQHVLEPLSGYLALAQRLWVGSIPPTPAASAAADAWNFGPSSEGVVTVREIVEAVVREWGSGEWSGFCGAAEQPHEAGLLMLDASKAERELEWRPAWTFEEAVAASVRWYREWADGGDARRLAHMCLEDIAAYAAAAARAGAAWAGSHPGEVASGAVTV